MNGDLSVRKLHPMLGVEVGGLSINREIPPHVRAELLDLVATHGLVLLRGQELGEDVLGSFARALGPIWTFSFVTKNKSGLHVATSDVYRYTNRTTDGNLVQDDHPTMITIKVNQMWHSDSTYTRPGSTVSIFAGAIVPDEGGHTEFCDTRIAYESLDNAERQRLRGLNGYHSIAYSNFKVTGKVMPKGAYDYEPVKRPLVRRHVSGRDALCIGSHVGRIDGLSDAECHDLLTRLADIAAAPDRVYSHKWQPGDVILWDNRCTMHRATAYDSSKYEREMWITRLRDDQDLENAAAI